MEGRKGKPGDDAVNNTPFGIFKDLALGMMPFGGIAGAIGDYMGDKVNEVQQDVDAGKVKSKRADDPDMGRVDVVDGRANSFGNPASDDRAKNKNGLGGGMSGGNGGEGKKNGLTAVEKMRAANSAAEDPNNPANKASSSTTTANNAAPFSDTYPDGTLDEDGKKKEKLKSLGLPFYYKSPINNVFRL